MVHSGSASPMKTTPSASPDLTVPAAAPPLVPPSGCSTDQDLTQTSTEHFIKDLTTSSDSTQPSTPNPADAEPPTKTTTKTLSTGSSPPVRHSAQTPTHVQGPLNGRTSGRKRTPKACDCCGPNSVGHNVKTPGRGIGRGRGRGRGRGTDRDLWDTPKRRVGKLTQIKNYDLTKKKVHETGNEDHIQQKVQNVAVADTQSHTPVAPLVPVTPQDGPLRNCVGRDKRAAQNKDDGLKESSGLVGAVEKDSEDRRDMDTRLLGTTCAWAVVGRGRETGMVQATVPSKMEVTVEINRGDKGDAIISRTGALPLSVQKLKENQDSHHGDQKHPGSVECLFVNGDTVDLSDIEGEMEDDSIIVSEPADGILSTSLQPSPALGLGPSKDLDSEMPVDQISDGTNQVAIPVTPSNGNFTTTSDHDQKSSSMEVETCHPATVSPSDHGPITVSSVQEPWALRDHILYCQPGTWAKDEMKEKLVKKQAELNEMDADTQKKENLEQLTDTVHGKMCFGLHSSKI